MLDKGWGGPTVTKDGVTVAEEIELNNKYENMGAQLVKEAASKASDVAGDDGAAAQLDQLKQQIAGLSGQDLAQNTDVAAKLSEACSLLRDQMLSADSVSALAGRLRRRVVLD